MSDEETSDIKTLTPQAGSQSGLLRFFWMAIGNFVLIIVVAFISKQPAWTITLLDAGYAFAVVSLLVARVIDVKRFAGETVHGEPATEQHLVRYGLGLAAVSAGLWALAQNVEM